ncbi:MAG TPA: hypothetical protein VFG23_24045 [Polyangia bacterium]|nr:hypothetical protein [Polyangia bacterium]
MDVTPTSSPPSSDGPIVCGVCVAKAGFALWLLAVWPLFVVKQLPHEDLPGHVAAAYVTDHLAAYPEYVAAHGLRTNSALLGWLHLASPTLGYMGAARVFVIAVLAITAFGYPFLFSVVGSRKRMWIASAFAIPFVQHWFVVMGMLNFSLSFAICLWILGLVTMQRRAWSGTRAAVIAALCAIAWIAHTFPLIILCSIALADLAYARLCDRLAVKAAWRAVASLVPAAVIIGLGFVLAPPVEGSGAQLTGVSKSEWLGMPQLMWMALRNYVLGASYWGVASLVPALVLLVAVLLRGQRRVALFSMGAVAVLIAGYVLLPSFMLPIWGYFNTRFVPFLWLALLLRVPETLPRKWVVLAVFAGIAGTAGNGLALLRMDADVAEFRSGLPFVEKGARLLPLLFSVKSPGDNIEPILHAWGHYAIERQTSAELLWASRGVDAVQYRTLPPPRFQQYVIQNMPRAMVSAGHWCETLLREASTAPADCDRAWRAAWDSYLTSAEKRYTYVLVWDAPAPALALIAQHFPIVHRQGRLAIGRRGP